MDSKEIIIKNDNLSAKISLLGGELLSFKKNNKEYIWTGDPSSWKGHAPILFPICGGLINGKYYLNGRGYDMLKHGFIRFQEFDVVSRSDDQVTLCFKDNKETFKCFPYHFTFFVIYKLTDKLEITYMVTNHSKEDMYFTIGSHEGYLLGDDFNNYYLEFEKKENLHSSMLKGPLLTHNILSFGENTNLFPLNYDDYKVDAQVFTNIKSKKITLINKNKGPMLDIEYEQANNIVIWSIPNAKFICIEPWSAVHDYIDSELNIKSKKNVTILSSGDVYTFSHSIRIR